MRKRMLSMVNQKGSFYICKSKEKPILFAHKLNYNILQIESLIPKYQNVRKYSVLLV